MAICRSFAASAPTLCRACAAAARKRMRDSEEVISRCARQARVTRLRSDADFMLLPLCYAYALRAAIRYTLRYAQDGTARDDAARE